MTTRERPEQRATFVLKIEGKSGQGGIRSLRWLLKTLLRRHGFRAIDVRVLDPPDDPARTGRP
jgi:hypothetical protein